MGKTLQTVQLVKALEAVHAQGWVDVRVDGHREDVDVEAGCFGGLDYTVGC